MEDPSGNEVSGRSNRTLVEEVLVNGLDDYVYASWVYQIAGDARLSEPSARRALALGLIAELLVAGLMSPGDFDGAEHQPWQLSIGDAMVRITTEWLAWRDEELTPGAVVWLDLTAEGRRLAEAIEARG